MKTNKETYSENETIAVTFNIKNTGKLDGKEVAQLYISDPESTVQKAIQELKGFKKVFVKSGTTEKVTLLLPVKELAYYNEAKKEWVVEPGIYNLKIGNSSRSIASEVSVTIK